MLAHSTLKYAILYLIVIYKALIERVLGACWHMELDCKMELDFMTILVFISMFYMVILIISITISLHIWDQKPQSK
jgi:hypothetical protein